MRKIDWTKKSDREVLAGLDAAMRIRAEAKAAGSSFARRRHAELHIQDLKAEVLRRGLHLQ